MMPLQFLHSFRSLFSGSLIKYPSFQSSGISFVSQILPKRLYNTSAKVFQVCLDGFWWYVLWTSCLSILQMSDGSLDLLFTWSALINLQKCVGMCFVWNLARRWSVQEFPEEVCPPFTLLLLVGEQFSTLGSDRSVWDLFSTCQCSCDGIELFHATLACCFLCLFSETVYEVPSVFSNASFDLLVGFVGFGLSVCFPDSRFAMIQHSFAFFLTLILFSVSTLA